MIPVTEMTCIETHAIIMGSPDNAPDNKLLKDGYATDNVEALANGSNLWDDDTDEEDPYECWPK